MPPGDRRVEHDVAEPGRAVVDRGDAQRPPGGVGQADGDRVADLEAAVVRDHAAHADAVAAHVAQVAGDDAEVERRRARGRQPGGAPRALLAEAVVEPVDLGRDDLGDAADAVERASCAAVPAGSGPPSRPRTTWSAVTRAAVVRSVSR